MDPDQELRDEIQKMTLFRNKPEVKPGGGIQETKEAIDVPMATGAIPRDTTQLLAAALEKRYSVEKDAEEGITNDIRIELQESAGIDLIRKLNL